VRAKCIVRPSFEEQHMRLTVHSDYSLRVLMYVRRHIIWNSLLPDLTEDVAHLVG